MLALGLPAYEEIDFYRYFWDAKQLLHGFNPYAHPVSDFITPLPVRLLELQAQEQEIVSRLHPDTLLFSTIYAPLAIGVFALLDSLPGAASLAFAGSFLLAEIATLLVLWWLGNERDLRAGTWALALNPLLILVSYNGLHFDSWLLPLLVAWVLLLRRGQSWAALGLLLLAIALRHWAVLLLPLSITAFSGWPRRVGLSLACLAVLTVLFSPQWLQYNEVHSGLRAYGHNWQMNDTLFLGLQALVGNGPARMLVLGLPLGAACFWAIARPQTDPAFFGLCLVGLLLLLSPTFFPWYWLWILPFVILSPHPLRYGFASLAVALPFYYLRFWLADWNQEDFYDEILVWFAFTPSFVALVITALHPHGRYSDYPRSE